MLSMSKYSQQYIDECRAKLEAQVSAYRELTAAVTDRAAVDRFEPVFFNNMVIVLENYFVHRLRAAEGKNGNPLNEVRMLSTSMLSNNGKLVADKQIRLDPAKSVLRYAVGDEIRVRETDFDRLCKAFFADLESKYL